MNLNLLAILIATVLDFVAGIIWFGPLFGNLWGKIHGFDKLSKATQERMMKQMGPFYAGQFAVTLLTNFILAIFLAYLPQDWNYIALAGFFWLGFVVPTQVSSVIFGGTEPKWMLQKILIQAGGSLVFLEIAAIVIHMM